MESTKECREPVSRPLARGIARVVGRSERASEENVYTRLKEHARRITNDEHALTVGPTGLMHDAYVRLPTEARQDLDGSAGLLCREMGRVVIDRARKRNAVKRGGGATHTLLDGSEVDLASLRPDARIHGDMDIEAALDALERVCPKLREIVRLRYEVGMTEEETAGALGAPLRTVQRDWAKARGLLWHMLHAG